jgi:hypothetical protein
MMRIALVAALVAGLVSPASAEWNRTQRGDFTTDCLESCQANPKVHPTRRAECGAYCGCVLGEAEKFITSADYEVQNKLVADGKTSPTIERFRKLFPMCGTRVFGN